MDTETVQYLMGLGSSYNKINMSTFKLDEMFDNQDGSGNQDSIEKIMKDQERVRKILTHTKNHIHDLRCALQQVRPDFYEIF